MSRGWRWRGPRRRKAGRQHKVVLGPDRSPLLLRCSMQPWRFFVQDRESRSTYPAAGAVNNIWGAHINLPFLWPSLRIYLLFREGPGNCRRNGSGMTEFSKRWVGPAVIAAGLVAFTTTILLA